MILFLLLVQFGAPNDAPSELLTRYLSLPTEAADRDSNRAAQMWLREAGRNAIEATTFSIDPEGQCTHFIAYLPATVSNPKDPILLLHHSDVAPAKEEAWKYSPYAATWVTEKHEAKIYGRGSLEARGPGVVHWEALKALKQSNSVKRSRDVFFVMNCGKEEVDPFGAAAFIQFLIRPLPDNYFFSASHGYELSSENKLEVVRVLEKFSRLPKVEFVWNGGGSFGSTTDIAPYQLVPIASAQKGQWIGVVTIRGGSGQVEGLVRGIERLFDKNDSILSRFQSLHSEQAQLASAVGATRPWWQRVLMKIYPRFYFEFADLEELVTNRWQARVTSESSAVIEYRFLGEKTQQEIETQLEKNFQKFIALPLSLEVRTVSSIPFRRTFFEDPEAAAFKSVIESYPQTVVSPSISSAITDSRFFRMAGIKAFDITPFFLSRAEIASTREANEGLRHSELIRAIDIESKVLQKLLR